MNYRPGRDSVPEIGRNGYGPGNGFGTDFNFKFTFRFKFIFTLMAVAGVWRQMAVFDPEKMAMYRLARAHSRAVHILLSRGDTRGFADLVAQLRSSTASIPANILEAAGEWRPGKRLNYFLIAKGSTWESWAHTDTLVDFGLVRPADIQEVRHLQSRITALLITSVRRLERDHPIPRRVRTDEDPPPSP